MYAVSRALGRGFTRLGGRYAQASNENPHSVAGATAGGIIVGADLACQTTLQYDSANGIDWARTLGLGTFAVWHYGAHGSAFSSTHTMQSVACARK